MSQERPPTIDPRAAARWETAPPAAASPWLHEEIGRRMEDRLQWIMLKPQRWAHWQPLRGGRATHALLARRFPDAACDVVEATPAQAQAARAALSSSWWKPGRWRAPATRFLAGPEALAPGSVQMLWANMSLHTAADPQALIAAWHAALATDGFLMFSCLGPDTLRSLRALYADLGWPPAGAEFTDMHDWGDMLVHAGFAEPVMDMERTTLTYETPERLLQDLREIGRNLHPARFPALRGRAFRQRLLEALRDRLAVPTEDGRLALQIEIIYGHALRPAPRTPLAAESAVSLQDMRSMLRGGRRGA
ncbi:biotin synthase [Xylophilus sp. GW821-FHT01B05]